VNGVPFPSDDTVFARGQPLGDVDGSSIVHILSALVHFRESEPLHLGGVCLVSIVTDVPVAVSRVSGIDLPLEIYGLSSGNSNSGGGSLFITADKGVIIRARHGSIFRNHGVQPEDRPSSGRTCHITMSVDTSKESDRQKSK